MYRFNITVPFGHCDIAGIVYTPRFSDYCMEATEQFLKSEVDLDWCEINRRGEYANPVMRVEMNFQNTVYIADELSLSLSISAIGRSSFTIAFQGERSGKEPVTCFTASMVLAFVDMGALRSIKIPQKYLPGLRKNLVECP